MRLPEWVKTKNLISSHDTKKILRDHRVATVCEEARCPNSTECFKKPAAAFIILGSRCTRNCGFCSVESTLPEPPDSDEPERVALAAKAMELKYVVVTSVTRDDLPDGGASHFAKTVDSIRNHVKGIKVEVLTPDFKGNKDSLKTVIDSNPDVFNHNIETVPRLYPYVRHNANYFTSIHILKNAKIFKSDITTKSGIMVGLGETFNEVIDVLKDVRNAGCDALTIGQYLRPTKKNLPVREYIRPEIFKTYKDTALDMGFKFVASSPLVRSSMNAEEMYNSIENNL